MDVSKLIEVLETEDVARAVAVLEDILKRNYVTGKIVVEVEGVRLGINSNDG